MKIRWWQFWGWKRAAGYFESIAMMWEKNYNWLADLTKMEAEAKLQLKVENDALKKNNLNQQDQIASLKKEVARLEVLLNPPRRNADKRDRKV